MPGHNLQDLAGLWLPGPRSLSDHGNESHALGQASRSSVKAGVRILHSPTTSPKHSCRCGQIKGGQVDVGQPPVTMTNIFWTLRQKKARFLSLGLELQAGAERGSTNGPISLGVHGDVGSVHPLRSKCWSEAKSGPAQNHTRGTMRHQKHPEDKAVGEVQLQRPPNPCVSAPRAAQQARHRPRAQLQTEERLGL